jgi:hypothetical protein
MPWWVKKLNLPWQFWDNSLAVTRNVWLILLSKFGFFLKKNPKFLSRKKDDCLITPLAFELSIFVR